MPSICAADTSRAMYCASARRRTLSRRVVGDAFGDQLVRQQPAVVLAVEPDDVEAVAGRDRRLAQLPGRERDQRLLEFRRGLPGRDLAEIAALRRRRTARVRLRQFGKALRMLVQLGQHRGGIVARARVAPRIGGPRREQDVRGLIDVGRAEPRLVVLVIAAAGFVVRLRHRDLVFDQAADQRFLVGLAAAVAVADRLRRRRRGGAPPAAAIRG